MKFLESKNIISKHILDLVLELRNRNRIIEVLKDLLSGKK